MSFEPPLIQTGLVVTLLPSLLKKSLEAGLVAGGDKKAFITRVRPRLSMRKRRRPWRKNGAPTSLIRLTLYKRSPTHRPRKKISISLQRSALSSTHKVDRLVHLCRTWSFGGRSTILSFSLIKIQIGLISWWTKNSHSSGMSTSKAMVATFVRDGATVYYSSQESMSLRENSSILSIQRNRA